MSLGPVFRVAVVTAFLLVSTAVPIQAEPNECVQGDLRDKSVSFRTEDDVQLSGLVLGSGPRGVILASYLKQSYCDWLPLAQSLADSGNQVLLFDIRFFELGDPRMLKDEYKYDLDLQAAAQELSRRGATSIVAGGEARTAAAAVLAAPRIQGLAGLVLVSPVQGFGGVERSTFRQVEPVLESLTVPVFIASSDAPMSNGDPSFADSARVLADVSTASGSRLDLVSGASHGVELVKTDAALRDRVVAFVDEVQSKPWYERFMWPMAGAVLVLGLLGALFVFRRRLKDNGVGAVSGDEAGQAFAAGHNDPAPGSAR